MNADELRKKYIEFFVKSHNHKQIDGKSVVPDNDPTVLFTTAGMHPLVPYLMGQPHPAGRRLVNVQKCIRTGDIDSVGDSSHLTFFEMLGNWSLGDYFKAEALKMSFEFITSPLYLNIAKEKLFVTVFKGDDEIPADDEAVAIWKSLGIDDDHIFALGKEDNWWGPAGSTGPCGPDSEMFLDTGRPACSEQCLPGCSCGKYMEFWNDVFMQYNKNEQGEYESLVQKNIDTGMGLERTVTLLQGKKSVFETEIFSPILAEIEALSLKTYHHQESDSCDIAFRIIADHCRTATIILGDEHGIKPSNIGQGYILRRLIRRAIRMARKIGIEGSLMGRLATVVLNQFASVYPDMLSRKEFILDELLLEEENFSKALALGEKEFDKLLPGLLKNPTKEIGGRIAFRLYDTFGFPIELTQELAAEHSLMVDMAGFDEAFAKHQELSKQGADKVFKGGLADDSMMSTKYHTATHLLNAALRQVLGAEVSQQGSNITTERLRFDFNWPNPMSETEIRQVEALVNTQIKADLPVTMKIMKLDEAKKIGAQAMFSSKYEDVVKVYSIDCFSIELCGGPHVESTGSLGQFKIIKEQSSSRGVRRIKAILE